MTELSPSRRPGLTPVTQEGVGGNMRRRGFTLVEIMIVVLIIGVLLSIAIPNMMNARANSQLKTCQSNMRVFDVVKAQWAMEASIPTNQPTTLADLLPYLRRVPLCPANGTYDFGTISTPTTCSLPEHPPSP